MRDVWLVVATMMAMSGGAADAQPLGGDWGGDRTILTFTAAGASLRQDCADGDIAGPVTPDAAGRFSVAGTYAAHDGGPQREDARPGAARYDGHIAGDTLHLTIHPAHGDAQQLTLVARRAVKLIRCL